MELPLSFTGWSDEVSAVRTRAGVCDTSHAGRIRIRGAGGLDLLERVCASDVAHQEDDTVRPAPLCDASGGLIGLSFDPRLGQPGPRR